MTPRKFDRYMVAIGLGTHPKMARLTDGEVRAHVLGVLAVAAMSPIRGDLIVGDLPAEPIDIAAAAGVSEKVASSAMAKLRAVGVLRSDGEHGSLRVHDWEDVNPPPKADPTRNERQKRLRDRNAQSNGSVTPRVPPRNAQSNAPRNAEVTLPEVEEEVEVKEGDKAPSRRASARADQSRPPTSFPPSLLSVAEQTLPRIRALWEERGGDEPTLRGVCLALQRHPDRDHLAVVSELEHWATAGRGRNRRVTDWARTLGTFLGNSTPGKAASVVVPLQSEREARQQRRLAAFQNVMGKESA